ncbi:MAG: hypothetical protein ACFE8E_02275 [Candidatus Hodarchaeota archaeon]
MIDDEDEEEEYLKKGISLKSVLKNLLLIALIIVGALFIYLGSGTNQVTNFFIGFSFICLGSALIQIQKRPSEPIRQTLSILKCKLCGVTKVRNYQHGDFVFKEVEACNDCNEAMEVDQIYSVKLKKPVTPKKEESKINVKEPSK